MNTQTLFCPTPYPIFKAWEIYAEHSAIRLKVAENQSRLSMANHLIRELQREYDVVVCRVDIATPRPRIYLKHALPTELPLRGVKRVRVDSEVFECSAVLDRCEIVWAEFEQAA